MKLKTQISPQRHITSDLAGAFASLSRMASSFIRDTEKDKVKSSPSYFTKQFTLFFLCVSVSLW
jgi:hypothetical protein